MAAPTPRKKAPKRPAVTPSPAPAGQRGGDESINDWLKSLQSEGRTITVFDRPWKFQRPTVAGAERWDDLIANVSVRAALGSAMFDETPADPAAPADEVSGMPGTRAADEFLAVASQWVPGDQFVEFWNRMGRAIFGQGEASAS